MNEIARHNEMVALVNEKGMVKVTELVANFAISPATARRDITKLDQEGRVKKVRNGIMRLEEVKPIWVPIDNNNTDHYHEKARIAIRAAKLCSSDENIVINCGSTAFLLGRELCGKNVSIITNYFPLACYLIEHDHENVIIMGGLYNKTQNIILNPIANITDSYAGKWMFTSGKTLTPTGLYKNEILGAVAEQQILEQIEKLVVVVDSSKIDTKANSGMLFCPVNKIDILITGKQANKDVIESIKEQGIEVILV
ncbi:MULTISPECIES: HTH-type transcriptional regulator UlaR [unclassified Gilliamella]|uniref:HTH-type transcriptional regulator UlaR n=1 Tax=unclassified Gilliamella TaxID=2685620 RepID=UPI00130D1435|nr:MULTISPECIES: HTH-type transcriptional regulator UlaR [unclassified Gilliamella]MWP49662.1 HTH-type transcriptional regulator UlaR [Gilliamella sp. Lep-s35]MWP68900.1 HTH-type transcriptional regulator UlaR [Gilliamella sp. Lep-s5]MWP77545.1 HTH-type transcriptional regulator UlaR [Gilliamella sp. Lep-s21]